MQLPGSRETHFQQNFSLKLQVAGFFAVSRIRFESDFDRRSRRPLINLRLHTAAPRDFLGTETGRLNAGVAAATAAAVSVARGCDSVTKASAGDRALDSF